MVLFGSFKSKAVVSVFIHIHRVAVSLSVAFCNFLVALDLAQRLSNYIGFSVVSGVAYLIAVERTWLASDRVYISLHGFIWVLPPRFSF
jgi:hypothetical protein